MKAARAFARRAVVLALVFVALTPTSVLAFTPPAPGNPGNHFGELLHNPHMQPPPPASGGKGGGNNNGSTGISNALPAGGNAGGATSPTIDLPALQVNPASGGGYEALTAASGFGQDSVLVVIILAALVAANVALAVIYVVRGGNFLIRRVLSPVPATA